MSRVTLTAFEEFFSRSPLGCTLCNTKGTFLRVNQAFSDLIGYSIPEVLHLSYWQITPQQYLEQERIRLQQLSERGASDAYEKEFLHRKGFLVPVHVSSWLAESDGEEFILSVAEPRPGQATLAPQPHVRRTASGRSGAPEWSEAKNARRCELIDRKIQETISTDEAAELDDLQGALRAHLDVVAPLPMDGAKKLHAELMRRRIESVP
jgi:PAS domain S-box-containing protein